MGRVLDILDDFVGQPRERYVLFGLAGLRAVLTGLGWWAGWVYIHPAVAPAAAIVTAIFSADIVEHWLLRLILGYSYNPNVRAQGEWEGWTGPLHPAFRAEWERLKMNPLRPWDGQPGSGRFGSE